MSYTGWRLGASAVKLAGAFLAVFIAALWPWMIGNAISGPVLAWVFESVYIALVLWLGIVLFRRTRAHRAQLAKTRAAMVASGQAWFDPTVKHYTHGTCTIRHRSFGAAQRCSSTI